MKTPLSMESPLKVESDPQKYREEWFNIAVPNGKEFCLPNVSNPILELPMTNFSLTASPQNPLRCQSLTHFPCNTNIGQRPPKYRPLRKTRSLPNNSSLHNIPHHQSHGLIINPIVPSPYDNIFSVRNHEDLNYQQAISIPMAHLKTEPTDKKNNAQFPMNNDSGTSLLLQILAPNLVPQGSNTTTTPPLVSGGSECSINKTYSLIPTLSLSSLLERQAKLENLNREFQNHFNRLTFDLIVSPDMYQYSLAWANSGPQDRIPSFAGFIEANANANTKQEDIRQHQQQPADACHYYICRECGTGFMTGHALGGHVSSHARKRKRELAKGLGREFQPGSGESFFDYADNCTAATHEASNPAINVGPLLDLSGG